ncbi:MAG: hypothetical protein E7Z81_10375 [Methanobrevibacter sp.]|jgi:hypothetical protein|uniref:hypothetical protein n=1 Tax=Methanobrevibacter sp. TaxID=66852 RepID=UPI0025DA3BFB|nr:hypothetical protein [Methanobrevibacter sp.]MBE6498651.1 hypothetical protein [Methanobrevibacter sp.]
MNFRERKIRLAYLKEAIACIAFGTAVGLGVYAAFLYFEIAIFGWNLGLVFAPLAAGYAETYLANKLIGDSIGAISAFILFIDTVIYGFILKNPTLGFNVITIGSIGVILQAAFPTLINYIIIVVGIGVISYMLGIFKRTTTFFSNKINNILYKHGLKEPEVVETEEILPFNEQKSNEQINSLDFYFITSTDILDRHHKNLGQYHATVIVEKEEKRVNSDPENVMLTTSNKLKQGKDECLIKLANIIQKAGGNCVVDLEIQYGLVGLGGDNYQITAMGMGIYLD